MLHRVCLSSPGTPNWVVFALACAVLAGCSARYEGGQVGDCSDGADNDADGAYDCMDPGCVSAPVCLEGPPPDPVREGDFDFGEVVLCADPVEGIARLQEVALERGIDLEVFDPVGGGDSFDGATTGRGGSLLAADVDADGDIDLMQGPTTLYLNDGAGYFSRVAGALVVVHRGQLNLSGGS